MNGKPETHPSNHVEWANGFKSNMPDWPTARRCAHSDQMLAALKKARKVLLANDPSCATATDEFSTVLRHVMEVIDLADGLDVVKQAFTMPPPPGFPKPPGVK